MFLLYECEECGVFLADTPVCPSCGDNCVYYEEEEEN
jgi:rubrerythrin